MVFQRTIDENNDTTLIGTMIQKNSCKSFRITFRANVWVKTTTDIDATLLLTLRNVHSDFVLTRQIRLVLGDMDFAVMQRNLRRA